MLKRHARAAITLAPSTQQRSYVLDDVVGAAVAGLAMGFALVTLYLAQRSSAQFGVCTASSTTLPWNPSSSDIQMICTQGD